MSYRHAVVNTVARQYNEKWRFPDYDCAIRKLMCFHVQSFLACNPHHSYDGIMHEYDVPVYVCKFCPSTLGSHILAVANENGTVCIENTSKSRLKTFVQTHNNTVFDLAWMPGERMLVTVSGDHSAKLWDCGESDLRLVAEFLGHTRSVKCVYFKPENNAVFATGSRDGSLIIWDARCAKRCSKIPQSHIPDQVIPSAAGTSPFVPKRKYYPIEASQSNSVTGLAFQNDNALISSGSSDQCVRVWDMRKTYSRTSTIPLPKHQFHAPSPGFSNVCIDPTGNRVYANSMDSYIYCFDAITYRPDPISAFYGHQNGSFYVKSCVSRDGWYLLSGSTDKLGFIWNTRKSELSEVAIKPIVVLPGHTAEVACIAMSYDGDMKVATCSDDGTYRVWYNYTLPLSSEEEECIELAEVFDDEFPPSVRTQWTNRRKRFFVEDDTLNATKDTPCTFHNKICRYYSNNLSHIACKCQRHVYQVKRPLEDDDDSDDDDDEEGEDDPGRAKRPSALGIQESTPLKSGESKSTMHYVSCNDGSIPKRYQAPRRMTPKRKLSDLPNFNDERESKRRALERILLPHDDVETNKCENEEEGVGSDAGGSQEAKHDDGDDNQLGETEEQKDGKKSPEFWSPTINLPNYVKDGTSPYIHRCSRNQKENVDWLTKLIAAKKLELERLASQDSAASKQAKNQGKVQIIGLKRKIVRSHSIDGKNPTLHKYFKISSRPSEISYVSKDIHKKAC